MCDNTASVNTVFGRILPSVKNFSIKNGLIRIPKTISINICGLLERALVKKVLYKAPVLRFINSNMAFIQLVKINGKAAGSQEYQIEITNSKIVLSASEEQSLLAGLKTLNQLLDNDKIPACRITDFPDIKLRTAHITYAHVRETMPYNVPDYKALLEHIDRLASLKYNAILFEPAAMFPYKKHDKIPCQIAFSQKQTKAIAERIKFHKMELIPMIQSLGHVYYVLMRDEYFSYRETPNRTQQYCPCNPYLLELYSEFIDDFMEIMGNFKYLHIGGDEARQMGICSRCSEKVRKKGMHKLWADYISDIIKIVNNKGLTPFLWSDGLEHWPEAMKLLPKKNLKVIYWNYDPDIWPRPYFADQLVNAGFEVVGCPAVRWGALGTELTVHYPNSLNGTKKLIPDLKAKGVDQVIVSNWMKGSPHELCDYGFAYNAQVCWNVKNTDLTQFNRIYANEAFGADDPQLAEIYNKISMFIPYAEPVQLHMVDGLDRLNVSGFRFYEKWQKYTAPEQEPECLDQLYEAVRAAEESLEILEKHKKRCENKQQYQILQVACRCILVKAKFALAMHRGRGLLNESDRLMLCNADIDKKLRKSKSHLKKRGSIEAYFKWCSSHEAVMGRWKSAKHKHFCTIKQTGIKSVVNNLNDLMFEPAELDFMQKLGQKVAGEIVYGKNPSQVSLPFLDNCGTAFERGLQHGEVFADNIRTAFSKWCKSIISKATSHNKKIYKRMLHYVSTKHPFIIEEMKGIARGCGLSFENIFWLNSFNAVFRIPQAGCSCVLIRDKDNSLWLGGTADIDSNQREMMMLRRVRDKNVDFYVVSWVGTVWSHMAMTSKGLCLTCNSAPTSFEQDGHGIPQHFAAYPLLFKAENTEQAVNELKKTNFAGKGLIYGLADSFGSGAVVEKTGTEHSSSKIHVYHKAKLGTNRFLSKKMNRYNRPLENPVTQNCINREKYFKKWINNTDIASGCDTLMDLFACEPFCQTGQENLYTETAIIFNPAKRYFYITALPPAWRLYYKVNFT